jgi:hypothetical protein
VGVSRGGGLVAPPPSVNKGDKITHLVETKIGMKVISNVHVLF